MKLNEKKFFELANKNNFEASDLVFLKSYSLSLSVFRGKVDSLTQHQNCLVTARGIINGKFGSATTEIIDKTTPEFLVDGIKKTATVIENNDPSIIFKGSEKYHKKSLFNKSVVTGEAKSKIDLLLRLEKKLLSFDKRINEVVSVGYEESVTEHQLSNSYGLNLKQKQATYTIFAEITAKDGDEVRSGYKVFASMDSNEFNEENFVKDVAEDALSKLGSTQCKSKQYPVMLNPDTASILISYLLSSMDADQIQKHSSFLEGKLNQQIVSKKITVVEDPLKKSLFFKYFDDEGVATNKKLLINKGVLNTYLYTLTTAKKDNVNPTGNGYRMGSKAVASTALVCVKPGRKSEEEVISKIKEGVYINNLEGLHAGMNAQSGNFSLQCSGFKIENGKLAAPLTLITVADNLLNMFNNVKEVCNNSKLILRTEMECPSILIKKAAISGK